MRYAYVVMWCIHERAARAACAYVSHVSCARNAKTA